jgi:hypothetical protein
MGKETIDSDRASWNWSGMGQKKGNTAREKLLSTSCLLPAFRAWCLGAGSELGSIEGGKKCVLCVLGVC